LNDDQICMLSESSEHGRLFQALMDSQKNLIVLIHNNVPILFNKAFQSFSGMNNLKQFLREFGSLTNRFVAHGSYFHVNDLDNPDEWIKALRDLPEPQRIVSMISAQAEPCAFAVSVEMPVGDYVILSFTDISQDLIKRIMIENEANIDNESGAYQKDYFNYTSKSFFDAAEFNNKLIGITMIELILPTSEIDRYIRYFTASVKSSIRQSDMLVRWGKTTFLLAYLIDSAENAIIFSEKLFGVMRQEPFGDLNSSSIHLGVSIQKEKENIDSVISRAETALRQSGSMEIVFV